MDFNLPTVSRISGLFNDAAKEAAYQQTQHGPLTQQIKWGVASLTIAFSGFLAVDWVASQGAEQFFPYVLLRLIGIVAGLIVLYGCRVSAPLSRKFWMVTLYEAAMFTSFVGIVALDPSEATVNGVSALVFLVCIYFVLPNHALWAALVGWGGTLIFLIVQRSGSNVEASGLVALLLLANAAGLAVTLHFQQARRKDFATRRALERANEQLSREIAAHHRTTAELRAATRAAETANDAKTRFLAVASHDLRQPVQAINLFIGALAAHSLPADTARVVSRLGEAAEALNTLLDTLLDISRMDAGLVQPEMVTFPLDPLINRLENQFNESAKLKNLRLRRVRTNAIVLSDPVLLERMISNLLSNAVRYTQSGGIVFGIRRRRSEMQIEVWDTGIGIPPDHLPRIFDEFHQVGNQAHNRSDGLGLGLAIVHRLSHLLGGSITATSVVGKGSRFVITLPALRLHYTPLQAAH